MMIELIQLSRSEGGYELLAAYEEALYELGGRPHWGQVNTLTGSHDSSARCTPSYDRWLDVRGRLDPDGRSTRRSHGGSGSAADKRPRKLSPSSVGEGPPQCPPQSSPRPHACWAPTPWSRAWTGARTAT